MNTAELNDLELEVDSLIENLNRLKRENQTLRSQMAVSAQERSTLQTKNKDAATKIRRIISQLKEELPWTMNMKMTSSISKSLTASARYVDEQMRKVRQAGLSMNTDRVAVVTALNISHELLLLKQEQNNTAQTLKQRVGDLRERVKNFLGTEEEIAV